MIKKTITYENYNGGETTKDFYFNMTALELIEQDLEVGGLEATMEELMKTEDSKRAYKLFKDLVIYTVGVKSEDGEEFIKTPEITSKFVNSPAMSEMIIGFLKDPTEAAQWVEGALPRKMIEEAKRIEAQQKKSPPATGDSEKVGITDISLPDDPPQELRTESTDHSDYTREELLNMTDEQFEKVAGKDPLEMSTALMLVAAQRRERKRLGG